jgi:hypothetical protein
MCRQKLRNEVPAARNLALSCRHPVVLLHLADHAPLFAHYDQRKFEPPAARMINVVISEQSMRQVLTRCTVNASAKIEN